MVQHEVTPEVLLLARIKAKMSEYILRQPDYTCVQTIQRSRRPVPSRRFRLVDTLRLEVALVDGKELFSWPGASEFKEQDLRDIVPTGAIGTGGFALHTRSVFLSGHARFTYAGEEERSGRRCVRYDYDVPLMGSGYHLKVGNVEGNVAYHGSFWADAETLELVRLEVHADDIPPHIPMKSADNVLEYGRVTIGEGDFLLPSTVVTILVDIEGNADRNEIRFSDCRQYTGESFISFGEPPPGEPEPAPAPVAMVELPGDLRLDLALETPIDGEHSKVGDQIRAVVRSDAKHKKQLIVPAGAVATARLVHLQQITGRVGYWIVALRLESLEFDGNRAEVVAELEGFSSFMLFGARASMKPDFSGATLVQIPRLEQMPGVGIFYVKGGVLRLSRGTRMRWRTEATDGEEKQ